MSDIYRFMKYKTASAAMPREKGVVLIVALIMVLLMAIIGVAAIRGSTLQEMMAGNMRDMNLRFQAAEAGLRYGEVQVDWRVSATNLPTFDGTKGFFPNQNLVVPVSNWGNAEWTASGVSAASLNLGLADHPRVVVEEIAIPVTLMAAAMGAGIDPDSLDKFEEGRVYRASSYHRDSATGAALLVQSLYKY